MCPASLGKEPRIRTDKSERCNPSKWFFYVRALPKGVVEESDIFQSNRVNTEKTTKEQEWQIASLHSTIMSTSREPIQ